MSRFLTDDIACKKLTEWSGTFTRRIRSSICNSSILLFLSTELNDEVNCCIVWGKVIMFLNSSDVTTARVMSHWTSLFGLKCEDRESLLPFYSPVKSNSTRAENFKISYCDRRHLFEGLLQ